MPTCISSVPNRESQTSLVTKLTKSYYQDDQQAKFMHLQAEIDSLLQQLESLKHQRLAASSQKE
ncbi:hypothetical protein VF14_21090 [Nostoc linckia z18]|jgi:hypothetical protein|uniref:Uncharacterized protein n=3 Tax=Nostoc TaxID=1177 RepID=A0A9Q6EKK1_NOSLI|nr:MULTISPECIES: hypothetical protein [Nostoc]MBL1202749.1 hypothetical protein [Nostoc sp. GBBB01]MDZ8011826.1 hypothetical protein [Nostoc sp. ZfuVER08]PHK40628.1 hypothetical protein VF12_09815 [Nostoc linckia z15]PHK44483.1 hypothetical protein VF13_21690 [Nostoc linckia z16]MBC1237803.1 hypothetical protein [Nostoc sp. 2RC]